MKKDGGVNVTCTVDHINVIHIESISFLKSNFCLLNFDVTGKNCRRNNWNFRGLIIKSISYQKNENTSISIVDGIHVYSQTCTLQMFTHRRPLLANYNRFTYWLQYYDTQYQIYKK